ncbi:MAG: vancomycin resistance protein [Bacteroidetes bacterium]|nr:MAG: vancomycin resistance protein [Bacteroidota bacterium]
MQRRKLLSQYHPFLYFLSVWQKRLRRYWHWYSSITPYAKHKTSEKLPFRVKKHQSVLLRKLGDSDMILQHNKVENLKIAVQRLDGVQILPKETFSFCKLVGLPTRAKGYKMGMELSFGEARAGIGGGLCQITNLLHWLVLHSPLSITERHHHSFDPFPDENRVLPFGSGATIFFNYRDFCFRNDTPHTFQIRLWLSEKCLEGELRCDSELAYAYHVQEKEHEFLKLGETFYRKNEIWKNKIAKFEGGKLLETALVVRNFARVVYTPETYREIEWADLTEEQKRKV